MSKLNEKLNIFDKFKKSITFKIFLTTSLLLITLSVFIYLTLYFFLPRFYREYKLNNLYDGLDQLVITVSNKTLNDSLRDLSALEHEYNIRIIGLENEYEILFPTRSYDVHLEIEELDLERYKSSRLVNFIDGTYVMHYTMTLQPVDEVANMLFMFIPYSFGVILCFTIVSVAFYSKIITKPLLQINRVAKRMADLEFDEACFISSDDEIGQLSQSLNQMSDNLEKSMMDLRNMNDQLLDDIQRERELEKKRSEFVATISHELKTPITTVKGQIEAMIYNIGPYKDRDKYLARSYKVMTEMESLVREVLTVSKLEHFEPKMEEVNLTEVVMSCSEKLDYFYKKKNIKLQLTMEEIYAWVDANLIKKAISNVIDNAVNYAPSGAKIQIDLNVQNQHPILKVYNSGTSIDEEEVENIFGPFYRIEKSRNRNTGGSGLGLYIVHQILDLHQIAYEIKNLNDGVQFTMIFPDIKKS